MVLPLSQHLFSTPVVKGLIYAFFRLKSGHQLFRRQNKLLNSQAGARKSNPQAGGPPKVATSMKTLTQSSEMNTNDFAGAEHNENKFFSQKYSDPLKIITV